ncbi:MAG TPA: IPT/TIG domain-containing protein, partial [Acidimicrobiales bacterium]|nr:IPT/TIG domain-containing protein [Acidimicrobiales bacterium]
VVPGLVHGRSTPTASLAPRAELGLPADHVARGAGSPASTAQAAPPVHAVASPPPAGASASFAGGPAFNEPVRVLRLLPSSGPTSGGNWVSLSGPGLSSIEYVAFGANRAQELEHISLSEVKVLAPAHAPGTVYVRAHSAKGTSAPSAATRYTYLRLAPATR